MRSTALLNVILFFCLGISLTYVITDISEVEDTPKESVVVEGLVSKPTKPEVNFKRIGGFAKELKVYAVQKNYNSSLCFLIDMSIPSGRNRFFVFDLKKDTIKYSGLVAHGSCNARFLADPLFSNERSCGCSSIGKYKVANKYGGRFGTAFKLVGLDHTNNNAFKRSVVLHAYSCVPDQEIYPLPLCNSRGCPMVSYKFLNKLSAEVAKSPKPILMWVVN